MSSKEKNKSLVWLWITLILLVGVFVFLGFKHKSNKEMAGLKKPLPPGYKNRNTNSKMISYDCFTTITTRPGKIYKIKFNSPGKSGLINLEHVSHFRIESDSGHYEYWSKADTVFYEPPSGDRTGNRKINLSFTPTEARLFIESRAENNIVTIKTWRDTF